MRMLHLGLTIVAALGSGLVGGVFFAFSSFVMKALSKIPPVQGMAAMQSINVVVINVSFMALLFGTALVCLGLGAWSGINWQRVGSGWVMAGCVLYLVGTIGTTIVFNVPRNDALSRIDVNSAEAPAAWEGYVRSWTMGNHVRTFAAVLACGCFVMGAVRVSEMRVPAG